MNNKLQDLIKIVRINAFSNVKNKINTQKLVVFLCTNNKLSKNRIRKIILFMIESKRIKHLVINLTKEIKTPIYL